MAEVVESVVLRPTQDGYEADITLKKYHGRHRWRPGTRKLWLRGRATGLNEPPYPRDDVHGAAPRGATG